MTWNHDISTAPQSGPVWLATKCGKVFRSYLVTERRVTRWAGLATAEQPVAWCPFIVPAHPGAAPALITAAADVVAHLYLEDVGGGQ